MQHKGERTSNRTPRVSNNRTPVSLSVESYHELREEVTISPLLAFVLIQIPLPNEIFCLRERRYRHSNEPHQIGMNHNVTLLQFARGGNEIASK